MPGFIRISGVRAEVDAAALARKEVRARVHSLILRLTPEGITALLPPGLPLVVHGINAARLQGRAQVMGVHLDLDVLPEATPGGRLRLRFTGLRAGGFVPLPAETLIGAFLSARRPDAPGVHVVEGRMLEIDLRELLARFGVELPPVERVGLGPGWAELHLGRPEAAESGAA
jgi:hypothetical protein